MTVDFIIDRLFMKLFRINNMDTVRQYPQFFKLWIAQNDRY